MRIVTILISILFCSVFSAPGQQPPEEPGAAASVASENSRSRATESLKTLPRIVTRENYRALGFQTPDEPKSASLGEPIAVFTVGLDDLRSFVSGKDPKTLLRGPQRVVYPVVVQQQVRSAVTLQELQGAWKVTGFGNATLGRLLAKFRSERASAAGASATSYFAVHIPALNLYFLGHEASGQLNLTPLLDDPSLELKAGQPVPGDKLFERLVPRAKALNDMPT